MDNSSRSFLKSFQSPIGRGSRNLSPASTMSSYPNIAGRGRGSGEMNKNLRPPMGFGRGVSFMKPLATAVGGMQLNESNNSVHSKPPQSSMTDDEKLAIATVPPIEGVQKSAIITGVSTAGIQKSTASPSWGNFAAILQRTQEEKWKGLPSMKKDFYVEHPEISSMAEVEVVEYRLSRNNITVTDLGGAKRTPPKPIKTFEHAFNIYPEILREIYRQEFKEPSPIQSQMWPIALSGYDVIGIAQTGTGKTLAFLLPIFIHLDNQPVPNKERDGPGCIILSPTRELALQIHSEVKKYNYKGITSVCIYGGSSRREQVNICTAGVDIVIATPGRLNDLVRANVINLKTVTFLVLDEADRMLDMGFEPQIKKVLCDIRPDRHTIMTSATWPDLVRELAQRYTKNPFMVFVGSLDLSATHTVTQQVFMVTDDEKMDTLMRFLQYMKKNEKVIIFVGKKNLADHLSSDLACKGLDCQSLHGDRDQGDREQALVDIKNGRVSILVATDLASRGLDIEDITHVFNYDFPRNIEEYVHRVGRTGRAGRSGVSITLITKSDWRHSSELVKILEEAGQEIPDDLRRMSDHFEQKKAEGGGQFQNRGYGNRRDNYGGDTYGGFFPSASRKKY